MFVQQSSARDGFWSQFKCFSRAGLYRNSFKRPLDLVLVLLALPVVFPLVLILALVVLLDGSNPFYSQLRLGREGRSYRMWKLRSMVVGADDRLAAYLESNPASQAEWVRNQKLSNDPRITRFGRLLRASSLDELPQLWNVIIGDMSLIGPRPMLPEQRSSYEGTAYYRLRPGLTGLWQVSARHTSTFAARSNYDERYDRELSLIEDVRIMICTVGVVLRRTGV